VELTFAIAVIASTNEGEQKEEDAVSSTSASDDHDAFLAGFHAGEHWAVEKAYRDHGARVIAAARGLVGAVDAETIAHEVFYRLLANEKMRASFRGGNLGAWLCQVAVRSAVDDLRRRRREAKHETEESTTEIDEELEAKILIERFRTEVLPAEFEALFDARFLRQLPQRDAARELGIPRSTLVYQEQKVRDLLTHFLLEEQHS
jgi:RNA polymerase sigma-70 factor, ECF subfamily